MDVMFSTVAMLLSAASLAIAIWHWRQANRPVVTARLRTHKGGNVGIAYWLEVLNTGSRPAKNVRLAIDPSELEAALAKGARTAPGFESNWDSVLRCFQERAVIPVLPNGDLVASTFGGTSREDPFWEPGTVVNLVIAYEGLEGQRYRVTLPIKIDDTRGFAGTFYDGVPEPRYS